MSFRKMFLESIEKEIIEAKVIEPKKKINEAIPQSDLGKILKYLKDSGIKIKSNVKTNRGIEIELFNTKQAESTFEDLKTLDLKVNITLENKIIVIKE